MDYEFLEIDPSKHILYINNARREILSNFNGNENSAQTNPLKYAYYIGALESGENSNIIGFSEYFIFGSLEKGFESSMYSKYVDLKKICNPEETAHIRTIYINEEYRRRMSALYLKLYLFTAMHAIRAGIKYATLSTSSKDSFLKKMYEKMGGVKIKSFLFEEANVDADLYLIDLNKLINQKLSKKYIRHLKGLELSAKISDAYS